MADFTLIANSGIQFFTHKINLGAKSDAMRMNGDFFEKLEEDIDGNKEISFIFPYYHEKLKKYIELTEEIKRVALDPQTKQIDESRIPQALVKPIPDQKIFTARARDAVQCYEGVWIPIPYLRRSYDGKIFQQGPETWAMAWISRINGVDDESEFTHNVVLAFDTKCGENPDAYLIPTERDAVNSIFECATDSEDNFFFCSKVWVQEWLKSVFERKKDQKLIRVEEDMYFQHVSNYLTFLKVLGKAEAFPKVTLTTSEISVDVDLILDVGNSRTTGILVESQRSDTPFDFTDAVPLEIRDMSYPDRTYRDPFDMRIAFAKAQLGEESHFILSGNPDAFLWPSLVRIGPEAQRLTVLNSASNSNAVMSSPKRYLWDLEKRPFYWTYISKNEDTFAKPALYGIAELFTEDGKLLAKEREKAAQDPDMKTPTPALSPYFSRSSVLTFALSEIFMQAISFANSYSYRKHQGMDNIPRKLKRVVLTCPTAMLVNEQIILREHAKEAIDALKTKFGKSFIDENLVVIPDPEDITPDSEKKKDWNYDEATCNQLTFLYGEIKDRFMNKAKLYIDTVGRIRSDAPDPKQPAVTIASVDIGGGTTDLMIASYQANPEANISVLTPTPLFWEGFNLAGDDILKRVIERVILPVIGDSASKLGCANSIEIMNFLFGPYQGSTNAEDKLMKKLFCMQIAIPMGTDVLQHASEERPNEKRSFDSFFVNNPRPSVHVIEYINNKFRRAGAVGFDLEKIVWSLNNTATNTIVRDVMEKRLGDLCGIIAQYDCDYVLLSGRPTLLPVIRDLFLKFLPVCPSCIVQLGHHRIGSWYPFADGTGVITDPKTCVVVGATVALMAGRLNRVSDFSINTNELREKFKSTADYIGEYDVQKAQLSTVFLDETSPSHEVKFFGHMFLGMRQMPRQDWIASPLYKFTYDQSVAEEMKNREPLKFEIVIDPKDPERIKPLKNITDKDDKKVSPDSIKVTMQSLADEHGYWMDSGIFLVQLFNK